MLAELSFWHWLIFAVVLLIFELFFPGAFMLWLAIAAGVSTLVALAFPDMVWQWQLVLFALFCVASIFAWRKWSPGNDKPTDQPNLNRRTQQYVGRTFSLVEAIDNGVGKVVVDDSQWKVSGADAPVGSKVKVVGAEGTILLVEPIN
ncbi:MAG: NfeD family protein [Arenicella sp.]